MAILSVGRELFQTLKGSLQTGKAFSDPHSPGYKFQTLKGSLQTLSGEYLIVDPLSGFKPSKDLYKLSTSYSMPADLRNVSNPQRISTNTYYPVTNSKSGNRSFKPSKDLYKLF
ncbi:MAG: hypothetical protein MjAS7_2013 [Metallosphaera javensis (ex Sakai et al. 2022)]|nr:MAG: hypothetical protein MjAS7_2013 [Metallosphaera javensis (ex Sakai et al. 2022)]